MSTAIAILGGVGLFLLGMTVMTDGLKALAGSALRTVLGKAAATPLSGAVWGAIVTLLVQSSSAVTMTTIGLVSAGLLTFPQGLGLVFGANIGTTGTAWLIALIGVRVSLSTYALPMIFVGALTRLLAGGRIAAAGGCARGLRACALWADDAPTGYGRPCGEPASVRSARGDRRPGRRVGRRIDRPLDAGRRRPCDDGGHAVLDRLDRGHDLGLLRRGGRARAGRRAHRRSEHRNGDKLGAGRNRRQRDG